MRALLIKKRALQSYEPSRRTRGREGRRTRSQDRGQDRCTEPKQTASMFIGGICKKALFQLAGGWVGNNPEKVLRIV